MTNNVYPPTCRLIYWVALLSDQPTTALGAGFAAGIWAKEQMFSGLHKENPTVFRPKLDETQWKKRADYWYKAVSRSFDLADLSL
jgi:glycerol kinase